MAEVLRVSITGAMPSGEEWSVNPVWSIGGDFGTEVTNAQALTIATAIAAITVPAGLTAGLNTTSTFTGCRVEARSLTGTLEAQAEGLKATPTPGTGSNAHPLQTAAVMSLKTGTPGASGRGRLYWPAVALTMNSGTMRFDPTALGTFFAGAKTYLSAIETAIDVTLTGTALGVWSRKNNDIYNVTSLQMGNVPDTQRRRRDALIEAYSSLPWP